MWFDELQAWSLTRYSSLFSGLLNSGEGHPLLWYALLWTPTRLSTNPEAMKIVTGLLGVGSLGLLWTQSPFSNVERSLISVSYHVGFNTLVLSRSYALGLFLSFLFAALYPRYEKNAWIGWLLLGLLANTHFFFSVVSFCLALLWVYAARNRRNCFGGVAWYVAGLGFCAYCVVGQGASRGLRGSGILNALNEFGFGFISLSNPFKLFYWNTDGPIVVGIPLALISLCGLVLLFWKCRPAWILVLFQAVFLIVFFALTPKTA